MASFDVFHSDPFTAVSLTDSINRQSYLPGFIGSLNLFQDIPIRTRWAMIEMMSETLHLIQTTDPGGPLPQQTKMGRDAFSVLVPRLAKGDRLNAWEIQNVRAWGTETELEQVQQEVARRQQRLMSDLSYTFEYHMLGCVQGIVLDADGSVLVNWFTRFEIAQPNEIDFDLDTTTADVRGSCAEVRRAVVRALGMRVTPPGMGIIGLASDSFWDDLVNHPKVRDTFIATAQSTELRTGTAFESFNFGGIRWVNYQGSDDNTEVTIADGKAKFFPSGVPGLFTRYLAPGEGFDFVNQPGRPFYALIAPDPTVRNEYVDIELRSYPLYVCTRPGTLQRGHS